MYYGYATKNHTLITNLCLKHRGVLGGGGYPTIVNNNLTLLPHPHSLCPQEEVLSPQPHHHSYIIKNDNIHKSNAQEIRWTNEH